jgi:hypothetical protein
VEKELIISSIALALICGGCLWGWARQLRRRRIMTDTPTSKTQGVFIGEVEVKGTAEVVEPLASFLAGAACVHYAWRVDEAWSRWVTETYTDSKGNTRTRQKRESGWATVAKGGQTIPFYLRDDTGVLLVRPAGAKFESQEFFDQTVGRSDPLYYGRGPATGVPDSDHRRRFSEVGIRLHAPLFVAGRARERADLVAPEIAASEQADFFLISTRTEEKISASLGRWMWVWGLLGLLIAAIPLIVMLGQQTQSFPMEMVRLGWIPPAAYLVAGVIAWVWLVYNRLIALRQRVRLASSLIEVQLKRRHDLIPRLVAVVAGVKDHEAQVQTALAALRAQAMATPIGVAGPDFTGLAVSIRAVAEAYPELKTQESFAALQNQLVETEQRVALARAYYNDIATQWATRLEIIPDCWVAALGSMKPEPLLVASDFERAAVNVELV